MIARSPFERLRPQVRDLGSGVARIGGGGARLVAGMTRRASRGELP